MDIESKTQRKRKGQWVDSAELSSLWDLGRADLFEPIFLFDKGD